MSTVSFSDLQGLYAQCRTFRRFTQEPVDQSIIANAIDAARLASCSKNFQPFRYIAITGEEAVAALRPLCKYGALLPAEIGMPKDSEQPTAFVAVVKPAAAAGFTDFDGGLAVNQLVTAAYAQGVGSCIVAAFNKNKAKEILDLGEDEDILVLVSLGYPDHASTVVEAETGGSLAYYVDENKDYFVPKKPLKDILTYI